MAEKQKMIEPGRLFELQQTYNADSRESWDRFAAQRRRITSLCLQAGARREHPGHGGSTLCILGAGNCNDFDLLELLDQFEHVSLVDLDPLALRHGVDRQMQDRPEQDGAEQDGAEQEREEALRAGDRNSLLERVDLFAPVDVSGIYGRLEAVAGDVSEAGDAVKAAANPEVVRSGLPEPLRIAADRAQEGFDVVLSVGLISQLIHSVLQVAPVEHPETVALIQAVRTSHLQLLLDLLRPGGRFVMTVEFVSSDTAPVLESAGDAQLPELAGRLLAERNHFTGLHPAAFQAALTGEEQLARQVRGTEIAPPWLWDFGPRTYAVTAFIAEKETPRGGPT